jgi:peptide/nickel transport system substrate-binding protein
MEGKMKAVYLKWISILTLVLLFLTSCTSNATSSASSSSKDADKPSGTLTVAVPSNAEETLLPWNGGVIRGRLFRGTIYETLVYKNRKSEMVPMLATKWERSPDGKVWTIMLRQGINFQEGYGELTSEDVKYSFERMAGPDAVMHITPALKQKLDHIEAPDKYKVIFYFKVPEPDFIGLYGWDISGIVCKKYLEKVGDAAANAHPIGTGPYMLAEQKKGAYVKLQTVPDVKKHWRLVPDFQYIVFQIVPEEVTRISKLKAGEADMVEMNFESIPAIAGNPDIEARPQSELLPATDLIRLGGINKLNKAFNDPSNPWANQKVRQALNYAVNREDMAKRLYQGFGRPAACESGILEWMDLKPYPYDVAKAKQLLAEAGYPNGFKIGLINDERYMDPTIGQLVGGYWKAIGLDVQVTQRDWSSLRQAWSEGKLNNNAWTHRTPQVTGDPRLQIDMGIQPNAAIPSFADEKTESLRLQIASELDLGKRSQLIKELGTYLTDQAAWIFLVWSSPLDGMSKKLGSWDTIGLDYDYEYACRAK